MRFWLLNASEQLAFEGSERRRMRTGLLAKALIERGHEVTWWKSTFEHVSKTHYRQRDGFENVQPGLTVGWLHSRGYEGHVSVDRLLDHAQVGWKFFRLAKKEQPPDCILCSMPIPELAFAAIGFGKRHKVPVVMDIRDWWPDLFLYKLSGGSFFSSLVRFAGQLALIPYDVMVKKSCAGATAITGITEEFVEWGLRKGNRQKNELDQAFPHGYEVPSLSEKEVDLAVTYWNDIGIGNKSNERIVSFIGSITRTFDFRPLINAARLFEQEGRQQERQLERKRVKFVFCGAGDFLADVKEYSQDLGNVVFTSEWVGPAHIKELLKRSSLGLVPLPDRPDFLATINNKTIEYLSAGVPLLVSPTNSHVASLVEREGCGIAVNGINGEVLFSAIKEMLQSPNKLALMSDKARSVYEDQFVASKVYRDFAMHLEKIAGISGNNRQEI